VVGGLWVVGAGGFGDGWGVFWVASPRRGWVVVSCIGVCICACVCACVCAYVLGGYCECHRLGWDWSSCRV